ncbi:MAG: hypothetical protein ABSF44_06700 [Candidatus Bathyarchaeia archaeon]
MKEVSKKVAFSFYFEHGAFLKEKDRQELGISIGEPIRADAVKEDIYGYEVCKDFEEINPETEAKKILALFENLIENHFTFLTKPGLTKPKNQGSKLPDPLTELYPELDVRADSTFAHLYTKVSEVIEDLVFNYPQSEPNIKPKLKTALRNRLKDLTRDISASLTTYYEDADCILGIGTHVSNQLCQKPIEFAFGISELDLGIISRICEGQLITTNPFMLKWVIDELAQFKNKELVWNCAEYLIKKPISAEAPIIPTKNLRIKCYVPSKEIIETGVSHETIEKLLRPYLMSCKPYLTHFDFLMPFTIPSIALEVRGPKDIMNEQVFTFYGNIYKESDIIFRFNEATSINLEFFNFPRFNKNMPVVLDTSAIDISRLPLTSPFGSFFEAYLSQRLLIIPKTAMHELKTRLGSPNGVKVQKALVRLNKMLTWGLLKEIKLDGEFSPVSLADKKDIEDLRDCIILDTAKKNNGILFTNDRELVKLANLMGIYTITFSGLEEDVLAVIKEKNLKLTLSEAVKNIQEYGRLERLEDYSESDIKWMIEDLIKQNRLIIQRIGSKEVIEYLKPRFKTA